MKVEINKDLSNVYFADFETTTMNSTQYQKEKHTDVWLWCVNRADQNIDQAVIGNKLDDFMKYLRSDRKSKIVYFHNLSFDGNFIFKHLLKQQTRIREKHESKDDPKLLFKDANNNREKKSNYFSMFSRDNKIYSIEIQYKHRTETQSAVAYKIKFLCSQNILPPSIYELGKGLGMNKFVGDDMDWLNKNGYITSKEQFYDLGGDDLYKRKDRVYEIFETYIKNDVDIAKTALLNFKEKIEKDPSTEHGFNPDVYYKKKKKQGVQVLHTLTLSSLAQKMVKYHLFNGDNEDISKNFTLKEKHQYDLAKKFYTGGFTQKNATFNDDVMEITGFVVDINSSYPASMTMDLPYGGLTLEKPRHGKYLTFVEVEMEYMIKDKHKELACIRNQNGGSRYAKFGKGTYYYMLEEFEFLKTIYNIKVKKIIYWYSKCDNYLESFTRKYYEGKVEADKNGDGASKLVYKTFLNSLYGSFAKKATYPELVYITKEDYEALREKKIPHIEVGGHIFEPETFTSKTIKVVVEDEEKVKQIKEYNSKLKSKKHYKKVDESCYIEKELFGVKFNIISKEVKDYPNLLVGAVITAYSRLKLLRAIVAVGTHNFVYCDTDSIFFQWKKTLADLPKEIKLDEFELGAWKDEFNFTRGKVLGAKRYIFENAQGKIKWAACGLTKKELKGWDEGEQILKHGNVVEEGKLQRTEDDYGIVLKPINVQIKNGGI